MESPEDNSNCVFDLTLIDDMPVLGGDLPPLEPVFAGPPTLSPTQQVWSMMMHFTILRVLKKSAPERGC